jgi:hypothetical protein
VAEHWCLKQVFHCTLVGRSVVTKKCITWWKGKNWKEDNVNDWQLWRTGAGNVWKLEKEREEEASFGNFVNNVR